MSDPRRLDQALAPAYDEERTAATWQRIAEARAGRRRSRRQPGWAIGLAVAATTAAAVLLSMWLRGADPGRPLGARDPAISLGEGARVARDLELDDGSKVQLSTGAALQVLANAGDRFVTLLEHGTAHFDVRPHGPRRWEIETSLATVEVVGTAFRVAHSDDRLVVEVERGVVMVRGERVPGRVVRLVAGERLVVLATTATAAADPATAPASATAAIVPAPTAPVPVSPAGERATTAATVAAAPPVAAPPIAPAPGSRREPAAAAVAHPTAAAAPPRGLDAALAEADRLRAAGDAAGAAALLDRALTDDDHGPAAGLAAFTLGRIALDQLGDPARAARAFARVIALGSPHGLLEDAYARRTEALIRAGDPAAARAALDDYQRAYPQGRRAAALREQLVGP